MFAQPLCLCEDGDATPATRTAQFVIRSPVRHYQSGLCCAMDRIRARRVRAYVGAYVRCAWTSGKRKPDFSGVSHGGWLGKSRLLWLKSTLEQVRLSRCAAKGVVQTSKDACVSPGEPKVGNFTWSSVGRVESMSVPPSHQILQSLAQAALRDCVSVQYFCSALGSHQVGSHTRHCRRRFGAYFRHRVSCGSSDQIRPFGIHRRRDRRRLGGESAGDGWVQSFELLAKHPRLRRLRPSHPFQMIASRINDAR